MSDKVTHRPALRPYLASDATGLAAIFRASIEELTQDDYDEAQRAAWISCADDEASFSERLQTSLTLVATLDGDPVGFICLNGAELIDMLYVHPEFARQGIASLLCDAIERLAAARGAKLLMTDASDTAKPFFERRGFTAEHRNTIEIDGEWLGNTRMKKKLSAAEQKRAS